MRALAILASHKQTGISGQMLAATTAGLTRDPAWEVETIYLADCQIGPDYPGHPNPVLRELEKKMLAADVWIISSPTYLGNMSGQLKNFFDCFRRRFYREDHVGRLFPGKFAGKRYVSLTSCYAGPLKNFIFRASNPPLEQVDKVLLDAGLVKVGEAVQTGTWKMKELPQAKVAELTKLGQEITNPHVKERWTLTVFRYIVLFFTIALVTLVTMGLQAWLFSFLTVAVTFWLSWAMFVVIFFAILSVILHILTVMQHKFK